LLTRQVPFVQGNNGLYNRNSLATEGICHVSNLCSRRLLTDLGLIAYQLRLS